MAVIEGRTWLQLIPPTGCERHLRHENVGRIAVIVDGHPEVFPVNYAVDADGGIVFRTDEGTKLDALTRNSTVAFEIDGLDEQRHLGWSVLAVGKARWVTSTPELAELRKLDLEPWAVGDKVHFVRVAPTKVTGRQIHHARKAG